MKKLSLLLLFTTQLTFAGDYELLNFSGSKVRTIPEILKETQSTIQRLSPYRCDAPDRLELFNKNLITNMAKDSLRVLDKNKDIYIYQEGELISLDGKPLIKVKDRFLKDLLKTLKRFESVPETRRLIEELQFSQFPFYIQLGGNRYSPHMEGQRGNMHGNDAGFVSNMDELKPMVDKLPFSQIGFGGFIYWNPKTDADFMEEDGVMRKIDTDIILAHEMYHAYDGMRGLLDRRFVKSDTHEFQPVCEYRAVRLENSLRKSLGYKYRKFYSHTEGSDQDMLDDNGEPIKIPTPCINWLK